MRRLNGQGLTKNEHRVLAAALRLRTEGAHRLYGYDLFSRLCEWEAGEPMNHGTLYRCLRSLERRGAFVSSTEVASERLRVMYELTPDGVEAAKLAAVRLAALDPPTRWVHLDVFGGPGQRRTQ